MSKEITYEQASKLLGISLSGVYDAVTRGKLHPIIKPEFRIKFLAEDEVIKYGRLDRRSFTVTAESQEHQNIDREAIKKEVTDLIDRETGFAKYIRDLISEGGKSYKTSPLASR